MYFRTLLPCAAVVAACLGLACGEGFANPNPNHANTAPKPKTHAPAAKNGHANAKTSMPAKSGGAGNAHSFSPGYIPATGNAKTHTATGKQHQGNHATTSHQTTTNKPQVINFPHHSPGAEHNHKDATAHKQEQHKDATAHKQEQHKDALAHKQAEHREKERRDALQARQKELQQKEAQERANLARLESDLAQLESLMQNGHHHHHRQMVSQNGQTQGVRLQQSPMQQNGSTDDQDPNWSPTQSTNTPVAAQQHKPRRAYDYADQLMRDAIRHVQQAIGREKQLLARQENLQHELAQRSNHHHAAPHKKHDATQHAKTNHASHSQKPHEHPRMEAPRQHLAAHTASQHQKSRQQPPKGHAKA